MKILIGADPELFVSKAGTPISAHGLVKGTKKEPLRVEEGAVQVDGTALEMNIDPAATEGEFLFRITRVRSQLEDMMRSADPELSFNITPSVVYPKDIFDAIPEEARELGCEPDYNAYTGDMNPRPDSSLLKGLETMRTGAGHVHIGWTSGADPLSPAHFADCRTITRLLDSSLGRAARGWDTDSRRSKLYGAPGAFRPKHYGLEYRSLSNAWLTDERIIRFVYRLTHKTVSLLGEVGSRGLSEILLSYPGQNSLRNELGFYRYYWNELGIPYPTDVVMPSVFGADVGLSRCIGRPALDAFLKDYAANHSA